MQDNLIDQGLNLMLYGMGTVFVFLTLLVFATTLMSRVVNRLVTEEDDKSNSTTPTVKSTAATVIKPQTLEAIKLAIKAHRSK